MRYRGSIGHTFSCTLPFMGARGARMHAAVFAGSVQVFWQPGGWRSHSRPEGEDGVMADWVSRADSRRHGWKETSCSTVSSHSLIDFDFADVHNDNVRLRLCCCYLNFTSIWAFKQHLKMVKIFAKMMITNRRIEAERLCLFRCYNMAKMYSIKTSCSLCFQCSRINSALLQQPLLGSC